jgi:hypothetical protein
MAPSYFNNGLKSCFNNSRNLIRRSDQYRSCSNNSRVVHVKQSEIDDGGRIYSLNFSVGSRVLCPDEPASKSLVEATYSFVFVLLSVTVGLLRQILSSFCLTIMLTCFLITHFRCCSIEYIGASDMHKPLMGIRTN